MFKGFYKSLSATELFERPDPAALYCHPQDLAPPVYDITDAAAPNCQRQGDAAAGVATGVGRKTGTGAAARVDRENGPRSNLRVIE
jgi:hypothetical protein